MLTIIDPRDNNRIFPFVNVGGRTCFALNEGHPFAFAFDAGGIATEVVLSVDGLNVLGKPASVKDSGFIVITSHIFRGRRISSGQEVEFVCAAMGFGQTTGEKKGMGASRAGLAAAATFTGRRTNPVPSVPVTREHQVLRSFDPNKVTRSSSPSARVSPSSSASVGAMAGRVVDSPTTEVEWTRGTRGQTHIVEYDTVSGWASRNVFFPSLNLLSPFPADEIQYPDLSEL